jgi:inosine/xanthosine triphosphatase
MTPAPLFAVGSRNPVKVACVSEVAAEFWPGARAVGASTESLVSAQPKSDAEMSAGARNRALQALEKTAGADYGVGIEGGVLDAEGGMWAYAWVVVVDRAGRVGAGQTGRFKLPPAVAHLIRVRGLELGEADDEFFGRVNSKQREGAIGILSDGRLTRLGLYKQGVVFALLPFLHPEYYEAAPVA